MTESNRLFEKKALPLADQLALLQDRGLAIPDTDLLRHYLTHIGYYRLSGYMLPFQRGDKTEEHHSFVAGTTFGQILDLYVFDRKLRLLVMDAAERIETALKSIIINQMCIPYGPHWYMNRDHFINGFDFQDFIKTIQKDIDYGKTRDKIRNVSIRHYNETYDTPPMPPLWMVFEVLTFGTVSYIYGNLPHSDQKRIADEFALGVPILKSWLHATTIMRNLCAHHGRLWNRRFAFAPRCPRELEGEMNPNTLFYAQAVMLHVLMKRVSPESRWAEKLTSLLDEYPGISGDKMGFPDNWTTRPVWQI